MKRLAILLFLIHIIAILHANSIDSLSDKKIRIGVVADYMGIGYHGYYFPNDNRSITASGEMFLRLENISVMKPYCSLGFGLTTFNRIGYGTIAAGILLGKGVSFCRIGGALAVAFSEHRVSWDRGIHNGGSGTLYISWGAQFIPTLGYTYLPRKKGISASLYISPHYALPTFEAPGPVESEFWISAGVSVGYIF